MKPERKPAERIRGKEQPRKQESAYGDEKSICMNAGCVLRKKARCFGFEGCPGFKGR